MDERTLVIDNDIFVLLAAAGRLDRAIEVLQFTPDRTRRLSALPFMLQRSQEGRSKAFERFSPGQRQAAALEVARFERLEDGDTDADLVDLLTPAIGYDAELYATLAARPLVWLHSADAAAMRRVCVTPELATVRAAVAGRVVSLEAVVYALIEADEYEATAAAFAPVRAASRTVRCLFPEGRMGDPLESARSNLRALCVELGPGFLHCPPCHGAAECRLSEG